ncbi:hypothetical protein [Deinococcus humi]|uniref:Uncharacterized protein n=1 Tax=Deinococcus humi TaxID=662880 RepID=A0A7W8JZN3_9DEIO|nr:hypothetical protein [Deinococcus humi]MBB5366109.1 hypothetical protein [Deinococcus humi]GGO42014.1 hypothetical protein GCM10008949_53590 [Deinococcus humi]
MDEYVIDVDGLPTVLTIDEVEQAIRSVIEMGDQKGLSDLVVLRTIDEVCAKREQGEINSETNSMIQERLSRVRLLSEEETDWG